MLLFLLPCRCLNVRATSHKPRCSDLARTSKVKANAWRPLQYYIGVRWQPWAYGLKQCRAADGEHLHVVKTRGTVAAVAHLTDAAFKYGFRGENAISRRRELHVSYPNWATCLGVRLSRRQAPLSARIDQTVRRATHTRRQHSSSGGGATYLVAGNPRRKKARAAPSFKHQRQKTRKPAAFRRLLTLIKLLQT